MEAVRKCLGVREIATARLHDPQTAPDWCHRTCAKIDLEMKVVSISGLQLFHFLRQRRDDGKQIADDSVIGKFEDRGFGILIDSHYVL